MDRFFTFRHQMTPFRPFSPEHFWALLVITLVCILTWLFRKKIAASRHEQSFRIFLGTLLILQEISLHFFRIHEGNWNLATSLPLHLCSIMVWSIPFLLFTKSEKLFHLLFLVGVASVANALLTPDMEGYGFPNYKFYQYFFSHGLILYGLLYMRFVHRYMPTLRSIKTTMLLLNLSIPLVMLVNRLTGGNYMFLAHKPSGSLLDFLGPWPWYILPLELLAVIMMLLVYALTRDHSKANVPKLTGH